MTVSWDYSRSSGLDALQFSFDKWFDSSVGYSVRTMCYDHGARFQEGDCRVIL